MSDIDDFDFEKAFDEMPDLLYTVLSELIADREDSFPHDILWLVKKYKDREDLRVFVAGLHFLMAAYESDFLFEMISAMAFVAMAYIEPGDSK